MSCDEWGPSRTGATLTLYDEGPAGGEPTFAIEAEGGFTAADLLDIAEWLKTQAERAKRGEFPLTAKGRS